MIKLNKERLRDLFLFPKDDELDLGLRGHPEPAAQAVVIYLVRLVARRDQSAGVYFWKWFWIKTIDICQGD